MTGIFRPMQMGCEYLEVYSESEQFDYFLEKQADFIYESLCRTEVPCVPGFTEALHMAYVDKHLEWLRKGKFGERKELE